MIKSMTAFGRAEVCSSLGRITAEIQSLNRKHLDLTIVLPKELAALETTLRLWISPKMQRGKITLKVTAQFENETPLSVVPNLPLAQQVKEAWVKIAETINVEKELDSETLFLLPDIFQYQIKPGIEQQWGELLKEAVDQAVYRADEMRLKEGKAIYDDFKERVKALKRWISEIEEWAPAVKEKYRDKLKKVLCEYSEQTDQEERILREVYLYAERVDITEELIRFQSHLEQLVQKLDQEGPVGKVLEFLLQELNREANTIGSKAQEISISSRVVEIKNELERIREQVQNVE